MELSELLKALVGHNKTGNGYQIQLNSGDLDGKSARNTAVEIGDLYFTECSTLRNQTTLCFGNMGKKPIGKSEDGTNIYPHDINTQLFVDLSKIETIEDVKDFEDWFTFGSERVFNIYMLPEDDNLSGNRNVITLGLMS